MDNLFFSKSEQVIDNEILKDSLKLIHCILKYKSNSFVFPSDTLEKLLDILEIYFEDFVPEKIFFNICYILSYLTEEFENGFFFKISKREKLFARILTFDIDTGIEENVIKMKIIKNLLKAEDDEIINVNLFYFF